MFNFFKKSTPKEVIIESPKDPCTPQVKSDMEYIKRIYDKLGLMWDNGDPRVEKDQDKFIAGSYRYDKDDYISNIVSQTKSKLIDIRGNVAVIYKRS